MFDARSVEPDQRRKTLCYVSLYILALCSIVSVLSCVTDVDSVGGL